ncbi:MAG: TonB-dependent receptor [Opitutaceae bacterium]|jgi:hypothetical protein|nr:TonB-dependent receptor [Opitutaceae bacterium]
MSQRSLLRLAPALTAALMLPALSPAQPADAAPPNGASSSPPSPPASPGAVAAGSIEESILLDKVTIEDIPADQSILPTRPSTSLYGFEETIRETPRSVFQVTKAHLDNDTIQSFTDLARYSPSVQRGSVSPYSVPRIRGGTADTLRNNIVLFNTAVRPFNDNAWESADIVAGIPSVIQGNTSRTAGYVNYVTKKPFFGEDQTELSVKFGRLGIHSQTTYPQFSVQLDHSTTLIEDKLALRVSLLQSEADLYQGNAEGNTKDIFAALAWKPNSRVTVETNLSWTKSDGALPTGINRLSQNLINNWVYQAGEATPVFGGGDGSSPASPRTITGWEVRDPRDVKIRGDQVLDSDVAGNDANEYIAQAITTVKLNDTFTLRNNTVFQYSDNVSDGYDFNHGGHINKLVESRFELLADHEFELFGANVRHQSNSGFSFRWLENTCNAAGATGQENPVYYADVTQPGSYNVSGSLALATSPWNRGPGTGTPDSVAPGGRRAVIYSDRYGWLQWTPSWGKDGVAAAPVAGFGGGLAGGEARINTLKTYNLFSEHKFDIGEKWTWRAGARLSLVDDEITTNSLTKRLVSQGYYHGGTYGDLNTYDDITAWNSDLNTSLNYRPARWVNVYLAYDHNISSQDCGCCQTIGFFGNGNALDDSLFDVKSELFELGAKFEIIPNQLFASAAWFRQTRQVSQIDSLTGAASIYDLVYQGVELALAYQPNVNLATGVNYSYIHAAYDGGFDSATSSSMDGKRFQGSPLNSANAWAAYRFDNGFGLKASAWFTSSWNVNLSGSLRVPAQHSIDLGAFYAAKKWRLDLDVLNVTNEKNWAAAGGPGGNTYTYLLPAERLGIQGKFSWHF